MKGVVLAQFLIVFLVLAAVAFLFCYGWATGIIYLDKVIPDPAHSGLTVGLSVGFLIPLGAAAGLGGIAYAIVNAL